ncbi:MAG: UDP-N-acetylmuramoyl-tripeptide--D-alanyl-D-alanine ligase [Gemmatimonadota bacterium]|nr:UDP-N-acetylmuramoyl-tripeptide--D-alanyl-D-alanine ligase [Gemmatimonadota bacterium]
MSAFRWTSAAVAEALRVPSPAGAPEAFGAVSTDTRHVPVGALFVALVGERFDGHRFLGAAADAGAAGAVVTHIPADAPAGLAYWVVEDTRAALGRLARFRRHRLAGRVVGVAGSNGKTSTKDLLRAVLGVHFRVHATEANLNNQIGVPLTLLSAPDDAEAVVVEMGTNEPGEIRILTRIVEPDAGVITSIGEEHLEKLVDLDGVLREEIALLEGIRGEGPVFVAEEPAALPAAARERIDPLRVQTAGVGTDAELRPDGGAAGIEVLEDGSTRWRWRGFEVHLPLPGVHNVRNALLALGVAAEWGVPPGEAVAGIAAMPRPKLRGEWHRIGGTRVLADCYNANPPGVAAALELLAAIPSSGRKIAVLGTMRELGAQADLLHLRVAEVAAERVGRGIDRIVATGAFARALEPMQPTLGDALLRCEDPAEAYHALAPELRGDETILLKASRGEALERWLELMGGAPQPVH